MALTLSTTIDNIPLSNEERQFIIRNFWYAFFDPNYRTSAQTIFNEHFSLILFCFSPIWCALFFGPIFPFCHFFIPFIFSVFFSFIFIYPFLSQHMPNSYEIGAVFCKQWLIANIDVTIFTFLAIKVTRKNHLFCRSDVLKSANIARVYLHLIIRHIILIDLWIWMYEPLVVYFIIHYFHLTFRIAFDQLFDNARIQINHVRFYQMSPIDHHCYYNGSITWLFLSFRHHFGQFVLHILVNFIIEKKIFIEKKCVGNFSFWWMTSIKIP